MIETEAERHSLHYSITPLLQYSGLLKAIL